MATATCKEQAEYLTRKDWKSLFPLIEQTEDTSVIICLTRHPQPNIRLRALQQTCPCRVQADVEEFWARIFEMVVETDPSRDVRWQLLHNICDGSPSHLADKVETALSRFAKDADKTVAHKARQALAHYNRTGKWNIM